MHELWQPRLTVSRRSTDTSSRPLARRPDVRSTLARRSPASANATWSIATCAPPDAR